MISKLRIVVSFKEGKSYLKDSFFTSPFRVAYVGQYKTDNHLYLMIMSSSPGLLDKDQYDISINLEEGARLQLSSQAYQRLYNMQEGATQKMTITIGQGSSFSYVPHPMVPHSNSKFKCYTAVYLQQDCELLLSEIVTCGRKHSGELFRLTYFHSLTEIYYQEKLVMKDNMLLRPREVPPTVIGQWEGYTHQGTLVYINTGKESASSFLNDLRYLLEKEQNLSFGMSEMAANGFVLRILGNGAEKVFSCFKQVQERLWSRHSSSKCPLSFKNVTL